MSVAFKMGHVPVMVNEVMDALVTRPDGVYIDGTLGAGGHAEALLQRLGNAGRLLGIDRDRQALDMARTRLASWDRRVLFLHGSYEDLEKACQSLEVEQADGILVDLGLSSLQMDSAERGFSFREEGPLDMRMDTEASVTAAELLGCMSEAKLAEIFRVWGEERFAKRIAREVVRRRRLSPIETTRDFASLVEHIVPRGGQRIHPATRVFQALRIAVNRELERLGVFLAKAPNRLAPGGRLVVLSYHSLEDRLVKRCFQEREKAGGFRRLTKKPLIPTPEEVSRNPRSRSAKLRVLERRSA